MKKIVVVGMGPVGTTLAVAASLTHQSAKIIGLDINPLVVEKINLGLCPFENLDKDLCESLKSAVTNQYMFASQDLEHISGADVTILAVGPTIHENVVNNLHFENALNSIHKFASPKSLLIISSTLPLGTMKSKIIERFRHLSVAYAFERITPGPDMLKSAKDLSKVLACMDEESLEKTKDFFRYPVINSLSFEEAEMAKLLENSYRAVNIALIHEWTLLAEKSGVNLFSVVNSIRERKGTHDNMRSPGPGVGGPCLVKDSMISLLNYHNLDMPFIELALKTSDRMQEHIVSLAHGQKDIGVIGTSYREGIEDLRNSPGLDISNRLGSRDIKTTLYDPLIPDLSKFEELMIHCDCLIIFHSFDERLLNQVLLSKKNITVIDTSNCITDSNAHLLHRAGNRLLGVGKGHWITNGYNK